jgi:hypothetical protein
LVEKRISCHNCGTRLEEWDPKKGGHLQAYVAEAYFCPGCGQIGRVHESAIKEVRRSKGPEMAVKVRLVDRDTHMRRLKAQLAEKHRTMSQRMEGRGPLP